MDEQMNWEDRVRTEAAQLGMVLFTNFKHCMDSAIKHAPDPLDVHQRGKVFEIVVQAFIGGMVNPICTFANTTKVIEDSVVEEVRLKFQWIRDREKDLKLQQLDQISQSRAEKTGLIIAPGGPKNA